MTSGQLPSPATCPSLRIHLVRSVCSTYIVPGNAEQFVDLIAEILLRNVFFSILGILSSQPILILNFSLAVKGDAGTMIAFTVDKWTSSEDNCFELLPTPPPKCTELRETFCSASPPHPPKYIQSECIVLFHSATPPPQSVSSLRELCCSAPFCRPFY